ncbi:hypothetical protein GE061_005801, partial [Apolygus lucorum]
PEPTGVDEIKQEDEAVKREICSCEGENENFINRKHFPTTMMLSIIRNIIKYVQWECKNCKKNNINKTTTYRCLACADAPGLCIDCFIPWHVSEKNFRTN